jgi:hypothetical protein
MGTPWLDSGLDPDGGARLPLTDAILARYTGYRVGIPKEASMRRKSVAVLTAAVLALAAPAAFADRGGVPHSTKPCPSKSKGNGPKHTAPNDKGKKCGFNHS